MRLGSITTTGFALALVAVTTAPTWGVTPEAKAPLGRINIIQALPGDAVSVAIDGKMVHKDVGVGTVLGPYPLSAGGHTVRFTDASGKLGLASKVTVGAGSSSDVVVHRPAALGGAPVVNSYSTPRRPIGPGKARVLIAHTATVAPADVRVDGTTVFTNIANGEYAVADVPAGHHRVALLPTGLTTHPILGPLDVTLKAGTVSMVYADGNPSDGSMNVILHTARLTSDGAVIPSTIDTGSAGLAAGIHVHPFGSPAPVTSRDHDVVRALMALSLLAALGLVARLGMVLRSRRPRYASGSG